MRWGLELLSVQLGPTSVTGLLFSRSQGTIYGNGSEAFEWNKSRSLSLAIQQSGWNPVGLNVKQMCPINLRRSPGSLMKTNVRAVSGNIHPAGFPLSHYSPVAAVSRLDPVYSQVSLGRGLCTTLDVTVQLCYRGFTRNGNLDFLLSLCTFYVTLELKLLGTATTIRCLGIVIGKRGHEQKTADGRCEM